MSETPPAGSARASSARLAAAADAERRSIGRALHDGVQQDLVALAVRLQLVRQVVASDVGATLALLDEIERDAQDALDGVRALSERIYPSLLTMRGLPDALRAAAAAAGVAARVDAAGVGRYPAEVEATVYFCCREALEHAGADRRAAIHLAESEGVLRFEVVSSGTAADTSFEHARDRVEALGGELTTEAEPGGGLRVAARIPLYELLSAR